MGGVICSGKWLLGVKSFVKNNRGATMTQKRNHKVFFLGLFHLVAGIILGWITERFFINSEFVGAIGLLVTVLVVISLLYFCGWWAKW